jgi:transposase-like protein
MSRSTISTFQLFSKFPDEPSAIAYLEKQLWPNGPVCPKCKATERITKRKDGFYTCNACVFKFTIRTATIFERSHVPLHKWVYAMYLLVTSRKGISSMQLAKEIGITQKSAWFVLHRLREACGHDTSKLKGIVEVDEMYVGGREEYKHMRERLQFSGGGVLNKTPVMGLRERNGRSRALPLLDGTGGIAIQKAVRENVEAGSTLHTDEFRVYNKLKSDYGHETVNHKQDEYSRNGVTTNSVESMFALMRRGLHGVYHKASKKHLARYANEFTWRLNEGNVRRHTLDRLDSFVTAVAGKHLTYERLISDNGKDREAKEF